MGEYVSFKADHLERENMFVSLGKKESQIGYEYYTFWCNILLDFVVLNGVWSNMDLIDKFHNALIVGKEYRRRDLHDMFGGQRYGGISTPSQYPFIMIFTGDRGEEYGYKDGWTDEGIFLYTGEGQEGDMQFIKGNKAILDHEKEGKDIHLFKYVRSGYVKYVGQMLCVGYRVRDKDNRGQDRKVIAILSKRFCRKK